MNEQSVLAEFTNLRNQEIWKSWRTKDLQLISAIVVAVNEGNGGSGSGGGGPGVTNTTTSTGTINTNSTLIIPTTAKQILGLSIVYPLTTTARLIIKNNNDNLALFNFRPINQTHILLGANRSNQLPLYLPSGCTFLNPNPQPITIYYAYQ